MERNIVKVCMKVKIKVKRSRFLDYSVWICHWA